MKSPLFAAALACVSFAAVADEVDVKKAVEAKLGKVEKIVRAPMAGIWEVTVDGQIFYADDKASYLLFGNMLDMKTGKNLTAERQFNSLPLELALKQVRGSGKNVMVTFEDPNCGYCKKLAKDIQTLKDVTVYTFLLPVLGDDSYEKSKAIWCAPDKAKAWTDWMTAGKAPPAMPAKCDVAGLNKSAQLGSRMRINGTPAIFFASGERVGGYIPAAEIVKRFGGSGG
ncbi:MAG: thiol:disulfide interchange protein [Rhodocyclales bacterium RIFCSPLOWO2_02_FULL_63_24]|nr:MAG: thiol:disulfide interchange protein [Rhodocyclales bacterium GWA2_65_19]OHC72189.1 MAG: thiol:disulfide interchange protein [Rhodocyclales bacterium RIFCSPLOWO2_02_FULL_63_24]